MGGTVHSPASGHWTVGKLVLRTGRKGVLRALRTARRRSNRHSKSYRPQLGPDGDLLLVRRGRAAVNFRLHGAESMAEGEIRDEKEEQGEQSQWWQPGEGTHQPVLKSLQVAEQYGRAWKVQQQEQTIRQKALERPLALAPGEIAVSCKITWYQWQWRPES
ncbi:hypothetical protein NDU88_001409 [Pleurodeles waltl]|uniref:Uncharacterized protein n=1 Tax=Pleurodeles waltl TaxID=8319 RepID=A0AAV7WKE7_PLEWA|nr:hypothetical protein NDU88_001409 [Pleurodeles waltl]